MPEPLNSPHAETSIYCLCEPGTKEIRYLGKADAPQKRLVGHLKYAKTGKRVPITCWILKLLQAGLRPEMHILRKVPQNEWKVYERAFIAIGRQHGLRLLNLSDGGDGFESGDKNPAHRLKGQKLSPEHVAKSAASRTGLKLSPERRAAISAMRKGQKASLETRAQMSLDRKGMHLGLKHSGASSKFIGVSRETTYKKLWRGQVNDSRKRVCVGRFLVEEEAALAVDLANKRIYGEKVKLNFPE